MAVLTPRKVFMVRSPSGVTRISEREVGGPSASGWEANVTPAARMSWAKMRPNSSPATLPMKPANPPREATPTMLLAAEPPEISVAGPMAA
jgi:hypothetical protein